MMRQIVAALLLVSVARAELVPTFSHATHAPLLHVADAAHLPCAQCHALDLKSGALRPPGADGHKPCSEPRCHGARLGAVDVGGNLCRECHEKAERWSVSSARLLRRRDAPQELGWRINHRRHAAVPGLADCGACHRLKKLGDRVAVHDPDHGDCAPCHGKAGSRPSLADCAACHRAGEGARAQAHGGALGPWRVYEKFSHEQHRLDIRTAQPRAGGTGRGWSRWDPATASTLGCGACHAPAARAESLADMDLLGPCAMEKTCMGQCHNGRYAFQGSTNMRDCLLCHSGVDADTPAPASHCGR
jgi:hypothetical protein